MLQQDPTSVISWFERSVKNWGLVQTVIVAFIIGLGYWLRYEYWPDKKERLRREEDRLDKRELFLHEQVGINQNRVDSIAKEFFQTVRDLTVTFHTGFEQLRVQGQSIIGKLDALTDMVPTMEEAAERWRRAMDQNHKTP